MQTAHPAEQEYDFYLNKQESVREGFERIIQEQIDHIIKLYESDEELSFVVHNSRKSFKRIRSTLRLIRYALPEGWFSRQNIFFRDLSMQVSEMRDAHVLMESLEILQQDPTLKINAFNTAELVDQIQHDVTKLEQELVQNGIIRQKHDLLLKHDCLENWPEQSLSLTAISRGLKSIYGKGYKAMQTAYLNPSPEHFHEWRKQVKHLLYSREILDSWWPIAAGCTYSEVKELSETLGLDHDLANLKDYMDHCAAEGKISEKTVLNFGTDITKKRQKLQKLADHLGKQIYAETDDFFIQHLLKHWENEGILKNGRS
jgi:CHAD domain-containing protein